MLGSTDTQSNVDLSNVPLTALGRPSRELLWALLDPQKVIPAPTGHPRDWRGLAALAKIPGQYNSSIHICTDCAPTEKVLRLWTQHNGSTANVAKLQEFLQTLDRWDVYDDTVELFVEDAVLHAKQQEKPIPSSRGPHKDVITFQDSDLCQRGITEMQQYHAYVLYAKEDFGFAEKLIKKLRSQGFLICCEEDLVYGFTTQVEPVTRLISERCQHIIVIYSPDFLDSEANTFYMDYAQSLGIKTNTRKLVPCMYRDCRLPSSYSFYHMLYYNEENDGVRSMYNFWDKLSKSLTVDSRLPRVRITEITSSDNIAQAEPMHRAICSASAATLYSTVSEPDGLHLPSVPEHLDSLSISEPKIDTLKIINKKTNVFKKLFKIRKSKSKKQKAKELLVAVAV